MNGGSGKSHRTQPLAAISIHVAVESTFQPSKAATLAGGMGKKIAGTGNRLPGPGQTLALSNRHHFTGACMSTISIVTGASRGLGRNTAISIARRGGDVILTYRSGEAEAHEVVNEIQALGRKAVALPLNASDVSTFAGFAASVRAMLKDVWGRDTFDHLVNNAGHGHVAAFAETTEAQFDALFNVHVKGVFFLTQALLPLLADAGRIINLSSGLTRVTSPGFSAYSSAKGAVETLSVCMAKELASRGITVNTVAPGAIETDFLGGAVRDMPELNQQFAGMTALGRVGVPDDIGPMIASLLGPDNRWVTGQRIEVSGGQVI